MNCQVKIIEPGIVNTDFGRSLDFANDESLTEYHGIIGKLMAATDHQPTVLNQLLLQK